MLIKRPGHILPSEITDEAVYLQRREFLKKAGFVTAGALAASSVLAAGSGDGPVGRELSGVQKSQFSTDEPANSWADVTTYNNYYEFGTGKEDPSRYAAGFNPRPWSVAVNGECDKPGTYNYEDLVSPHVLEERIYRLRCVEAWSMVIPWVGIPLANLLKQFSPNSRAKFVRFKTLLDPSRMPGQRRRTLDWPYVEGLTIEEAMHPLTLMAVGLYGRELPNQNGAPMRLVVPWKYGFKSIKAIVEISFTSQRPVGSWEKSIPDEYGFYANVNPEVSHPRWSQARERPIGAGVFASKKPTLMFNGYADQVASLYTGLDLRKNF
ncbi:MAG TPA: protein-methionine-sulfoxide reductase catalytic subunit MsrP [Xanthomonadales bacterium]